MYEVDEETMLPVKVHTYVFDLHDPNPEWKWHHEYTEYYNMPDLSPSSFDQLTEKFLNDETVALKFHNTQDNGGGEKQVDSCDQ